MYTPRHFAETDLAQLDALAAASPFATLITMTEGAPFISHVPVLYARVDGQVSVQGHWSRANPQWHHGHAATLILHGPHGYVSPSWYPDKESAARVPTWNYTVAHLAGTLELVQDEAGLGRIVSALTDRHEAQVGSDWRFDASLDALRSQLQGIVGFRLQVDRIELKLKLSQNHPRPNVVSVAAHLASAGADGAALSRLMLEQLALRSSGVIDET